MFLNFGSLNLDFVYSVTHSVRAGETLASTDRACFAGGKGLNQSLALARAGGVVAHAGCVGEDGGMLRQLLEESGVNTETLLTVDGPTGHAIIQLDQNGQNSILLFGGANHRVTPAQIDKTLAAYGEGDSLIIQNEISHIPYLMTAAASRGMRVIWNPSPFAEELKSWPLSAVSCFVVNEIEGEALTGRSDPEAILDEMRARYPHAATLLTLGSRGSCYDDGTQRVYAECVEVPVVDTTAAGDTFLGYFFAHLDSHGAQKALQIASTAAGMAVSVKGAANSIPLAKDVYAFMEK